MSKKLQIRNSTAEFLIFQLESKEEGIEVLYQDETLWLTQDAIAALFDKGRSTIAEHLQNIFQSQELQEESVCRKFRRTATDGKGYATKYYNLDAVISVGYRANSVRATQFRQWCTYVLRQFAIRGYVIDKKRMENGTFINEDYFGTADTDWVKETQNKNAITHAYNVGISGGSESTNYSFTFNAINQEGGDNIKDLSDSYSNITKFRFKSKCII